MNGEKWRQTAEEAWNDAWEIASHHERDECLKTVTVSALLAISHDLARLADAQEETASLMRAHLASEQEAGG